MKDYLRQQFCPPRFHENCMNEFLELSQGNLSIEDYHQAFAKLIRYAPNGMVEGRILNNFVRKLNPPLDQLVKNYKLESIAEAVVMDQGFAIVFPSRRRYPRLVTLWIPITVQVVHPKRETVNQFPIIIKKDKIMEWDITPDSRSQ